MLVRSARGAHRVALTEWLGAELAEQAEIDANRWIKALRHARVGGQTLRDRFTHRGDSLWWFGELYFHKTRVINTIFRTLYALEALVAAEQPQRLSVVRGSPEVRFLAARVARRAGVEWAGGGQSWPVGLAPRLDVVVRAHAFVAGAGIARWRTARRQVSARATVAGFVHAAFWRGDGEQYIGPILRRLSTSGATASLALVGVGPGTTYRARSWRNRVRSLAGLGLESASFTPIDAFASARDLAPSREIWRQRAGILREMLNSADLRSAAMIGGCDTWPLLTPVLAGVAYLQFPWSAHVMDQLGASLDALKPGVALTYAEAGGWGRALVLEARRRGIPTVGLQHGFIYRHWLNYLHEPDEMAPSVCNPADRGFPHPTLTLLYDTFAAEHLQTAGHFPESALAVTGSARLDALVEQSGALTAAELDGIRQAVGARPDQHIVVVASKFTQIRRVFPALVDAVAHMPDVRLVVKCHPAETGEPYLAMARGVSNVTVAPVTAGLATLTRAARLLVTVNSTAAIEAMVMGLPSLVLALPNNLSPFVGHGALAGVAEGDPIAPALRALLTDENRRSELRQQRTAFMARYGMRSDGLAADRAAAAIVSLAVKTDKTD
ncbi:MAG: hypothetical protein NTV05_14230 [Acidobacteria bacterium]|nr:hypothetical protein [Acidobacteriota bacterium]